MGRRAEIKHGWRLSKRVPRNVWYSMNPTPPLDSAAFSHEAKHVM